MSERQDRLQKWFDRGLHAIGCVVEPRPIAYVCPLCLGFFDLHYLTAEHVPPKAVGGQELVLTCKNCNEQSGNLLDTAAADEEKQRTWGHQHTAGPLIGKVIVGGKPLTGSIGFDGTTFVMIGHPGSNNPATVQSHTQALESLGDGGSITLTFPWHATTRFTKLSWLRAAYLGAFALYGYRYVLQPAFDPLRAAIADPHDESFEPVVRQGPRDATVLDPTIAEVTAPDALVGWRVVTFGPRVVFLPPWSAPPDWFANLDAVLQAQRGDSISVNMLTSYQFPTRPMHLTDG